MCSYRPIGKALWTIGIMALVYLSRVLQEELLGSWKHNAVYSSTLAWIDAWMGRGPGLKRLPSEQETTRGQSGWEGLVKRTAVGSDVGPSEGGVGLFIATSRARSRERSSVEALEGWANGMHWVGMSGENGDMSSRGVRICCRGWATIMGETKQES